MPTRERRAAGSRIPELRSLIGPLLALSKAKRSAPLLYLELTGLARVTAAQRRRTLLACKREIAAALRDARGSVLRSSDLVAAGPQARWFVALLVGRAVAAPARAAMNDADLGTIASRLAAMVRARLQPPHQGAARRDVGVLAGWSVIDPVAPSRPLDELRQAIRGAAVVARVEAHRATVLAAVTHELRTPLMSIIGYAERLRDTEAMDHSVRARQAAIVAAEAQRLHRLVETLIDAGAWTAGRLALSRRRHTLSTVVRSAWRALSAVRAGKGVRLHVRGNARALVDADRLEQVFINLLDNALRHSQPKGTVYAHISAETREILVAICDEGPGFKPRMRIVRAPFAINADGRAGLGLSIARLLVEAHGGKLDTRQMHGGGARLEVRIPSLIPTLEETVEPKS
ncbi:MAG: hypothetical protein JO293_05160 [Candidatus Eremiobacteraeota bacterium]|nr:hypothetical protein [Candidatus Eremiobacteraeota bacterium]